MLDNINKIILGDCINILAEIPDDSIDLAIIDPPYNLGKNIVNDDLFRNDYIDFCNKWFDILIRKLKFNGSLYCFVSDKYLFDLGNMFNQKLKFRDILTWYYNYIFGDNSKYKYSNRREFILYYTKSDTFTFNEMREKPSRSTIKRWENVVDKKRNIPYDRLTPSMQKRQSRKEYEQNPINIYRGSIIGNVFKIPRCSRGNNPETTFGKHPTQKPEELIKIFINVSSNPGDLVADVFAGSGTTLVAAKKLGRKFFGIEIDKRWFNIALKRLDNTILPKKKVF